MDIRIAPDVSVQAARAVASTPAPALMPIPPPPAIANISPFGDLMGKLRELSEAAPATFREVTAQLRDVLHSASAQAPVHQASALGDLAQRFDAASQTGSLASLQAASTTARGPDLPVVAQLVQHVDAALQEVSPAR
jgi:hypothetical protein